MDAEKDPKTYLGHIVESCEIIEEYLRDISINDFFKNRQLQDSVIRRLEIIGEAAKYISEDFKKLHQEIPWRKMTGLRDVLIHEYFGIDNNLVWGTIKDNLPRVKEQLKKLLF